MTKTHKKLKNSPTLNTILMVEEALMHATIPLKAAGLKKRLPKQVNHNTLKLILEYLEHSQKIDVGLKGITWIFKKGTIRKEVPSYFI